MAFVSSSWYIVMALLFVAIIGLIVTFVLMNNKDKALIENFVAESQKAAQTEEPKGSEPQAEVKEESKE